MCGDVGADSQYADAVVMTFHRNASKDHGRIIEGSTRGRNLVSCIIPCIKTDYRHLCS